MKLKKLLEDLDYSVLQGNDDLEINSIQYDSRKIQKGDVFFCIKGFNVDGHKFISSALQKGASAIVCEEYVEETIDNATVIKVEDGRKALALCSANFYGRPAEKMKIIGITGTNGKTTSAFMIKSILEEAGYKVGLIGTIANYIGNEKLHSERTTPESLELHELFKKMVDKGVHYCVMEVSSHSLSLNRVYGVKFCQGIFTNLTQDHLDFHKTFENYYGAKLELFKNSANAIVNIDDSYGEKILSDVNNRKLTYGIHKNADIKAEHIEIHPRGAQFKILYGDIYENIDLQIPGNYNVYNALGSAAACLNEGIDINKVIKGLNKVQVPGRCEIVTKQYNLGFDVIVDYAHTPDGLQNILETAREFTKGRLISVFGCGGDRDKTKRPIMGEIGAGLSDVAIITSDNPRTEDPDKIIEDIVRGITKENYIVIADRREGIKKAMEIAKKGDVIVVAGKGHEDYQVLKNETIHFDEREVIAEIVKELF
ncbi:UDP-N-acetylmuramoyl-L-alanyl-D-glutamate--2,6-diaminopimelate ligase [Haloimpatiens lingqiaonensis]|uniref:UDP-N-acetylmuramoyl-L-alanyl-D-glutamate--2, 6-diaminopimelate ligase n=1 Tax=Haloimpatiens lingqiaonensis TaxID=1380675 RepID=UPI0010FE120D|nr:UDP-N-acetylmuramoyl-L-alanyl-D-glutamate--2,6-diaminopimelate ligase [Haloimpatiens lingqiaonensis]